MTTRAALEKRLRELEKVESTNPEARREFVQILEQNNSFMLLYRNKWLNKLPKGVDIEREWPIYGNDVY